jgi:DNA-directed RNA polymerase I, II, and III subunit RPABC1
MDPVIQQTTIEMLQQRGFDVEITEENLVGKKGRSSVIVFFNLSPKVNNDRIQEYITKMRNANFTHAIVVYNDSVTPMAQKVVDELEGLRIELFQMKSLRYNITKHRLVPKHTLLTKSEMKSFKEQFGTKIPILLHTDPIARFYDFQKSDIVKVERTNGFICYRIVK